MNTGPWEKSVSFMTVKRIVRIFILCAIFILAHGSGLMGNDAGYETVPKTNDPALRLRNLYAQILPVENRPAYHVFSLGMKGYDAVLKEGRLVNRRYLTLIDFSLSSNIKRLWVIDLESMQTVHHSLVSHGKNTGYEYALKFSNVPRSCKSSLGFYVTGNTYMGKHGLSLKLDGIEKQINDNARKRAIVIHGANYTSRKFIDAHGRLGRSFGCPALPVAKCRPIIDTIKGRSCLFIYYPDQKYFYKSKYAGSVH